MTLTLLAVFAASLAFGTWLGMRLADEGRRLDDVVATILSTPLPEPSASAAHDLGAADTGARAGTPLPGAGPTPKPPVPAISRPATQAPGLHR